MKKFDAEKFYTEFRTGLFGAGWTDHDVATCHEHVEALEATIEAALNVLAAPVTEEVRNAVIEECAMVAETYSSRKWSAYKSGPINGPDRANPHVQGEADGATDCAEAIRALVSPQLPHQEMP